MLKGIKAKLGQFTGRGATAGPEGNRESNDSTSDSTGDADEVPSVQEVKNKLQQTLDKINEDLAKIDLIEQSANKCGVSRVTFSGIASGLILFALFTGFGAAFIVNLVGFLYPAFMSFKALQSPNQEDDVQWLTYWVCFAFLNLFETVAGFFLSFIPFYNGVKCIFLFYLFLPQTKGADFMYHQFVEGFFKKHEETFTRHISQLSDGGSRVANTVRQSAEDTVKLGAASSILSSEAPEPRYCKSEEEEEDEDAKKDK